MCNLNRKCDLLMNNLLVVNFFFFHPLNRYFFFFFSITKKRRMDDCVSNSQIIIITDRSSENKKKKIQGRTVRKGKDEEAGHQHFPSRDESRVDAPSLCTWRRLRQTLQNNLMISPSGIHECFGEKRMLVWALRFLVLQFQCRMNL